MCLLWLVPSAGLVVTSFRTADAVSSSGWWTVITSPFDLGQYTLANYRQAWYSGIGTSYLSSIAIALPAVLVPLLVAAVAGYAFTFMRFRGQAILYALIVSLLVVPSQVALAPLLQIYSHVRLNGTYAAVYLAHIGFGMPLAVFLLRTFMATLPRTVIDCARVDGASGGLRRGADRAQCARARGAAAPAPLRPRAHRRRRRRVTRRLYRLRAAA